jgi:phosphoribosylglycinamide formyltransferase 1
VSIGAICSAGGSSLFRAIDISVEAGLIRPSHFVIVTDRPCGAEDHANARGIAWRRIEETDREAFSEEAARFFAKSQCDFIILSFTRLVSAAVYKSFSTVNVHPSLLPAFSGFHALKRTVAAGARFVGATLHVADGEADAGSIIAQVISPIHPDDHIEIVSRISYIQKTYLNVCAIEWHAMGYLDVNCEAGSATLAKSMRYSLSASPGIQSGDLISAFGRFQADLGLARLQP